MIGFYNYTVILTYAGLASAFIGMTLAAGQNIKGAIICLMISGLCDMLDGAVARTKKRTETEQRFGIQIDSLCDLVSFGVFPAYIGYCISAISMPGNQFYRYMSLVIGILFALAAVIRLAYFNVMEEERQRTQGDMKRKSYQGLPVTNISLIFPVIYLSKYFLNQRWYPVIMLASLLITAFLFLYNFKVIKANAKQEAVLGLFGFLIVLAVIFS